MQQQPLQAAVSTQAMLCRLQDSADKEQYTARDFAWTAGEIAAALVACWATNLMM